MVAAATMIVGIVDLMFSFSPFLVFALASALSWILWGLGPCVFTVTLSVLASDFLFVQPRYELSWDERMAGLAAVYCVCALFARAIAYSSETPKPRLPTNNRDI